MLSLATYHFIWIAISDSLALSWTVGDFRRLLSYGCADGFSAFGITLPETGEKHFMHRNIRCSIGFDGDAVRLAILGRYLPEAPAQLGTWVHDVRRVATPEMFVEVMTSGFWNSFYGAAQAQLWDLMQDRACIEIPFDVVRSDIPALARSAVNEAIEMRQAGNDDA